MIKLTLFDTLMIQLLDSKFLARIVFDTSRAPFSFDLKLGLFYKILPWFNSRIEVDTKLDKCNKIIDII